MASFDINQMLQTLSTSLPPLEKLASGSAYVIGITLALKGLYNLKIYGEARSMMATHTSAKEPVITLLVAGMLIYFPSGFAVMMQTIFGYSNILAYSEFPTSSGVALSPSAQVLLNVVQVIGGFAFVRGWILLARSAQQGAQQGMFAKGMMFLFGGVFAMNIVGTFNVIAATFGITF